MSTWKPIRSEAYPTQLSLLAWPSHSRHPPPPFVGFLADESLRRLYNDYINHTTGPVSWTNHDFIKRFHDISWVTIQQLIFRGSSKRHKIAHHIPSNQHLLTSNKTWENEEHNDGGHGSKHRKNKRGHKMRARWALVMTGFRGRRFVAWSVVSIFCF